MPMYIYMAYLDPPTPSYHLGKERKMLIIYQYIRKEEEDEEKILVPLFCLLLLSFNLNIHAGNIYRSGRHRCCCCFLLNPLQSSMCMKRKREISHWSRTDVCYFLIDRMNISHLYVYVT